ncbi:MAG: hypothetical protein HZB26_10915 [Candidatus Hydrogenedentes bacterium]|nr:hypothetical protein [Candidatus Hydrogenedentota bacterium]
MVTFDADFLCFLLREDPGVVLDPTSGQPVERAKEKIEHLIYTLEKARDKILIPAPALSEILCLCGHEMDEVVDVLLRNYGFEIAPFDIMAAIEAAIITGRAKSRGSKKGASNETWAKVKFDRQIIAITKTRRAETIYSNDTTLKKSAERENIRTVSVWELPDAPPKQAEFFDDDDAVVSEPD